MVKQLDGAAGSLRADVPLGWGRRKKIDGDRRLHYREVGDGTYIATAGKIIGVKVGG